MKDFVFAGNSRGRLYLERESMKIYRLPFFVLKLSTWPNLIIGVASVLMFLIPVFHVSDSIRWLLSIITAAVFLVAILGTHRMISEHYAALTRNVEALEGSKEIKKAFKKQVLESVLYTAIVLVFWAGIVAFGLWRVYCDGDTEYETLLGLFAALPMVVAYWACMRPIKTLVCYIEYKTKER